jgi:hypothetical protein
MINDDNQKIKSMKNLLHELQVVSDSEELQSYDHSIDSLRWMRYDQRSMVNKAVVALYDSTSNALAEGLIIIAEARREFAYNVTLQKLVQEIRIANQRKHLYRSQYDEISRKYNVFLQTNGAYLDDVTQRESVELRPLFRATNGD